MTRTIDTLTARWLTLPVPHRILPQLLVESRVYLKVCRCAFAIAMITLAAVAPALAQERVRERHDFDDPEGRLIAYYSSALLFSALGAPERAQTWALDAGVEVGYIPALSKSQRTAFQDKPE